MIKELSSSKLNSFKQAQWPILLVKTPQAAENPSAALGFRTMALKVCKLVLQFMDIKYLLHLAEVINSFFHELTSLISTPGLKTADILSYLK